MGREVCTFVAGGGVVIVCVIEFRGVLSLGFSFCSPPIERDLSTGTLRV